MTFGGWSFHKVQPQSSPDANRVVWQCSHRSQTGCRARVITDNRTQAIVLNNQNHNHGNQKPVASRTSKDRSASTSIPLTANQLVDVLQSKPLESVVQLTESSHPSSVRLQHADLSYELVCSQQELSYFRCMAHGRTDCKAAMLKHRDRVYAIGNGGHNHLADHDDKRVT